RAEALARDFDLQALRAHLPVALHVIETAPVESQEEEAPPPDETAPELLPADDSPEAIAAASPELEGADEPAEIAEPALIRTPFRRVTRPWRDDYSASLVAETPDAKRQLLDAAIAGYLADPVPSGAPELSRFLEHAVEALRVRGETARAWAMLEHTRLLELQPSPDRLARGRYPDDWLTLIEARGTEGYQVTGARALARALEGVPVDIEALRKVLGKDAALLQLFALPRGLFWYAIDTQRLGVFPATSPESGLPEALVAWLNTAESPLATLYVDDGARLKTAPHQLPLEGETLGSRFEVCEALSATYLLASYEARNLTRGTPAPYSPNASPHASLVYFDGALESFGDTSRAGGAQVELQAGDGTTVDLDALASTPMATQASVFKVANASRTGRLLAHAALLAGSPATVTTSEAFEPFLTQLSSSLDRDRIATVMKSLGRPDVRLYGYRGMALSERIDFAFTSLIASARQAAPAYRDAQKSGSQSQWRAANASFGDLIGYVEYLLVPAHEEVLRGSSIRGAAALAAALPARLLLFKQQWANTFASMGEIDRAAELRREVAASYEASAQPAKALGQFLELGRALLEGREYSEAREALERCASLARGQNEVEIEADCRSRLGSVYRGLYDYEAAREAYESSIALYARLEHPDQLAPARYLGFLYETALNDYESALVQFEFALDVSKKFEEQRRKTPAVLIDIARIYRLRGEFERALESVREARRLVPDDDLRQLTEINLENANIYWYRGSYRRARQAQNRALELATANGDTFRRIQALSVGGLIAMNQGTLDEAEMLIRSALELSRITKRSSEEAAQLNNLGVVLQRSNRLEEAVESFSLALQIDERLGSREGRAFDLRNLGTAYGRLEQYDTALVALDEALALSRELGIKFNEVESLYRRGEVLENLNKQSEAGAMYDEASVLAAQIAVPEVQWRSLYALGRLEEQRGQTSSARAFYERSLRVAERLGRSRDESARGATRDDLYEDAIRLAISEDNLADAFQLFERRSARARLDAFSNRAVTLSDPEAQRLLRQELRSRDRVYAAERDVSRGRDGARERLAIAREQRETHYAELVAYSPRIARSFNLDPAALSELQAALPANSALVSTLVGNRRSYALLVQRDSVKAVRLEANRATLLPLVRELRERMDAFAPVDSALRALGGLLLEPLASELQGVRQLIFVPDTTLSTVPLAAMPLGDTMLVDRFLISEVSSASLLVDLIQETPARLRTVSAFAYGTDLPFANLEARSVSASPTLAADATIARLRADTSDAWDLAVHATLDPRDPLGSALKLAPSAEDDGRLEASEVFDFPRVPALVSLSGCETAIGSTDGRARLSLADSFLTAGAQSVVATQSRVSDLAAALLMKWFYRARRQLGTAAALNAAMLKVRKDHPHPA
ncbi:MAG: CHAT domain-containing tetratricopeptide repeat protein, partial [Myxococcota bacterium]